MNIFYLDRDPKIAAQLACDKHVVKMILESAQMLCTAHRVLDGDEPADHGGMYKMVHKNHPSTIWTRTSEMNYQWHWRYFDSLLKEYTHRYGKHHATERLRWILRISPINIDRDAPFTDPPQCMPDILKCEDTVLAYQSYYIVEKARFARWTKREVPTWFKGVKNGKGAVLGLHEQKVA